MSALIPSVKSTVHWKRSRLGAAVAEDRGGTGGVLRVSALHYSAGDQVAGGFRTVASARALCQPTSCGSEYLYNKCP